MDAATIAALSGAPPAVVLGYVILALLRDRRRSEARFLRAIGRLESAIRSQSTLLIVITELIAPGRAKEIEAKIRLFEYGPPRPAEDDED